MKTLEKEQKARKRKSVLSQLLVDAQATPKPKAAGKAKRKRTALTDDRAIEPSLDVVMGEGTERWLSLSVFL